MQSAGVGIFLLSPSDHPPLEVLSQRTSLIGCAEQWIAGCGWRPRRGEGASCRWDAPLATRGSSTRSSSDAAEPAVCRLYSGHFVKLGAWHLHHLTQGLAVTHGHRACVEEPVANHEATSVQEQHHKVH